MAKEKEIIEYNDLCLKCKKKCKQFITTKLVTCPNFVRKEEQLEIKFPRFRKSKK